MCDKEGPGACWNVKSSRVKVKFERFEGRTTNHR